MNIRNIWRDTAGYLIVGLIALLVVGLFLIPVYIFDRPKSDKYKIADAINAGYAEFKAKQNVVVPKSPLEKGDQGGC